VAREADVPSYSMLSLLDRKQRRCHWHDSAKQCGTLADSICSPTALS
jgi:hypothetical protein